MTPATAVATTPARGAVGTSTPPLPTATSSVHQAATVVSTPRPLTPTPLPPTPGRVALTPAAAPTSSATKDGMTVSVAPGAAPVGGRLQITGRGLNPRGRVNPSVAVNLRGEATGALALLTPDNSPSHLAADGSLTGTFVVPPRATPGAREVCITGMIGPSGAGEVCTAFTVLGATEAPGTPQPQPGGDVSAVVGRYVCSTTFLSGTRTGPQGAPSGCTGFQPELVLQADGRYQWGSETGTYTVNGTTVRFSRGYSGNVSGRSIEITQVVGEQRAVFRYVRTGN